MTMLTARSMRRGWRRSRRRGHILPVVAACTIAMGAMVAVGYLLRPTWRDNGASNPDRIPVSVGATLFNIPDGAFRLKIQKHSGSQERVDLSFDYPSLQPPDAPHRVSADTVENSAQPIERIFLTIAAHENALSPETRARTIYPRYLDAAVTPPQDGLSMRAFRETSAYAGDDLFFANAPPLIARCTRESDTPGMCLSERRVDGADLTFRFPRAWLLSSWRNVAAAMDRLTAQLREGNPNSGSLS